MLFENLVGKVLSYLPRALFVRVFKSSARLKVGEIAGAGWELVTFDASTRGEVDSRFAKCH